MIDISYVGRPDLVSLFKVHMSSKAVSRPSRARSYYDWWDDDYSDEELEMLKEYYNCGMVSDDDGFMDSCEIHYYSDYHKKDDATVFRSYDEFFSFCKDEGIVVTQSCSSLIRCRYQSHCCLDPVKRDLGVFELIAEASYGSMFYDACDARELDSGDEFDRYNRNGYEI